MDRVDNPVFPNVQVMTASSQDEKQKAIVLVLEIDGKEINCLFPPKVAVEMGKAMLAAAIGEMDRDEVDDLEDLTVIRNQDFDHDRG